MGMMIQFPSPALWHQVLSGPPVGKDQGTRNPIGGFTEMVHAQLAKQNAIAGLQQPPRPPQANLIQRAPERDNRDKAREKDREKERNPRGQQQRRQDSGAEARAPEARPPDTSSVLRAVWA